MHVISATVSKSCMYSCIRSPCKIESKLTVKALKENAKSLKSMLQTQSWCGHLTAITHHLEDRIVQRMF